MTKIESVEVVATTMPDMFGEPMHLCLVRVEAEGGVGCLPAFGSAGLSILFARLAD